ncbi:hypothetical protein FPQ18DRAFT_307850 [Pyronema domesticum]|nr:hypothetical protein FPQ18DRAFT_307850 [Pyronema domesticum]
MARKKHKPPDFPFAFKLFFSQGIRLTQTPFPHLLLYIFWSFITQPAVVQVSIASSTIPVLVFLRSITMRSTIPLTMNSDARSTIIFVPMTTSTADDSISTATTTKEKSTVAAVPMTAITTMTSITTMPSSFATMSITALAFGTTTSTATAPSVVSPISLYAVPVDTGYSVARYLNQTHHENGVKVFRRHSVE